MTEGTMDSLFKGQGIVCAPCKPPQMVIGTAIIQAQIEMAQEVVVQSVRMIATTQSMLKLNPLFVMWK